MFIGVDKCVCAGVCVGGGVGVRACVCVWGGFPTEDAGRAN